MQAMKICLMVKIHLASNSLKNWQLKNVPDLVLIKIYLGSPNAKFGITLTQPRSQRTLIIIQHERLAIISTMLYVTQCIMKITLGFILMMEIKGRNMQCRLSTMLLSTNQSWFMKVNCILRVMTMLLKVTKNVSLE